MCHPEVPTGTKAPEVRTEEVQVKVEGGAMPALLALPERAPAPGIVIVNDVFGRSPFYEHLAGRLAQAGFVALDAEYFFRQGPLADPTSRDQAMERAKLLDFKRTVDDMTTAIDWLTQRPEVRGGVGTIGFCMGGTFVLMLAARRRDIAATVSYYGFPADARPGQSPIDVAAKMTGPILGHWGDQDTGVGMPNVEKLDESLKSAGVEHEFHIYPGFGHGFLKAFLEDEKSPGYEHACTSWKRTLDFYRSRLTILAKTPYR